MATLDEFMQAMSGKPTAASRSREFEHKGLNRKPPTLTEIQEAIRVGQLPSAFRSQEPGLQGGVPTETITGLNLSPLDLFGTGIGTKIAGLGAKGIGLAGIFAGVNAKTANLAKLELAQKLKQQVVPDREIYAKTGWTFGFPDSKPRFEIPDNEASLSGLKYQGRSGILENSGDLKNSLTHPELYKAYPETSNIQASIYQGNLPEQGSFSKPGMQYNEYFPQLTAQGLNAKSPALHELQHAIQQREGFARGGSPEMFNMPQVDLAKQYWAGIIKSEVDSGRKLDEVIKEIKSDLERSSIDSLDYSAADVGALNDFFSSKNIGKDIESWHLKSIEKKVSPIEQYKRLAGEAEARLTQARMNMTPEQRAASYPLDMFDVPVNEQIVRYGEGNALSLPAYKGFEILSEGKQFPVGQTAIKLKDGTVLTDNSPIHALQIKKLQDQGIPTSEIESGGFIRGDGSYIAGSADTPRIIEQDRARKAVEQKRSQRLSLSLPKTQYELAHELAQRNAALPVEQGGLGLLANNTAMERAKAMGYQTAPSKEIYHSARGDWESNVVDPSISDIGFHAGTLEQAENRAKAFGYGGVNYGEGANIIPLMMNKYANMLRLKDTGSFHADAIASQLEKKGLIAKGKGKQIEKEIDKDWQLRKQYDPLVRDVLAQNDYHGIKYANEQEGVGQSYAFTDPSQIRSRFAAFDPLKRNSSDLLASLLPITTTGLLANQLRQSLWAEPQPD